MNDEGRLRGLFERAWHGKIWSLLGRLLGDLDCLVYDTPHVHVPSLVLNSIANVIW